MTSWRHGTARPFPPHAVVADGHDPITVVSRFGRLHLTRQVLAHRAGRPHVLPGNAVLPAHHGVILTRGLQEWACLLPQELPFASVERLLGWQTQDAAILSATTVRSLVRRHGLVMRQAEQAEAAALLADEERPTRLPVMVPHQHARRRAGWPAELNAAIEAALAAETIRPPEGVSWADWERVVAARRAEAVRPVEELRTLGPILAADEVLLLVDEVLTRQSEPHHFWELRTAKLVTREGCRYVSGTGEPFLHLVLALTLLWAGPQRSLLLIADGARWIRRFFQERLAGVAAKTMVLDWDHLARTCTERCGTLCRSREEKQRLVRRLTRRLWAGKVDAAVAVLEGYRRHAKDEAALDRLISYLHARAEWIPNYRQRRREQQYIGSGQVEKANDQLVARRQKNRGMQWSEATSDGLAALRTLMLNGGWDRYWVDGEVLPLAEAA